MITTAEQANCAQALQDRLHELRCTVRRLEFDVRDNVLGDPTAYHVGSVLHIVGLALSEINGADMARIAEAKFPSPAPARGEEVVEP